MDDMAQSNTTEPDPLTSTPHNIEAEQALLGTLLLDNEVYFRAADYLKPEHFYDPVHGHIFQSIAEVIGKGGLADAISLKTNLEHHEGLGQIGGVEYLARLLSEAASSANAPEYARLIYDLALRRDLMRIGDGIVKEAMDPVEPKSGPELIEDAEQQLFSLAETGGISRGFRPFNDALSDSMAMAAAAHKREGGLSGVSSGLRDLDHKLGGMHQSDLIIIAGRPSMGKTALATNIAFHVARNYKYEVKDGERHTTDGGVVAFFSLEMSAEQLATRLLAEYTGISSSVIRRGELNENDFDKLMDAAAELNTIPLHIDDTGGLPVGALAARARRLKRTHKGLDLIVVDYLQLVTAESRRNDGRVQEVSEITQRLKALAKELDVPVIALSQLSRQVENREDKKPQLSDLRESGSIEQDADVVMFVYREAYYLGRTQPREDTPEHAEWQLQMDEVRHKAEIIVGKQRHGPIGNVDLSFREELTKFGNLDQSGRYDESQH